MIYFLQDAGSLNIKIGYTASASALAAEVRRKALQTGNASRLVVLAAMPGGEADEARLHTRFDADCVGGEWFRPTPGVLRLVSEAPWKADDSGALCIVADGDDRCYRGVQFPSALLATWAAFFDLIEWEWEFRPLRVRGWQPDFRVSFRCGHSECPQGHTLLVQVLPVSCVSMFAGCPGLDYPYGWSEDGGCIGACASAAFGNHPSVSRWEFCHGSGGGEFSIIDWVDEDIEVIDDLWQQALGDWCEDRPRRAAP